MNQDNKHIFALYHVAASELLGAKAVGQEVVITDKDLCQRVTHILRLRSGDLFILFDHSMNMVCEVVLLQGKKSIVLIIKEKQLNVSLKPDITFALPLLKRVDLESAIYALTEVGVNAIQLIESTKVARKWGGAKELDRLNRIVIAAAEQSKNFSYPSLYEPVSFDFFTQTLSTRNIQKFYFDPMGSSLLSIISTAKELPQDDIILTVGPEGGFTDNEKIVLQKCNFMFCALTPTVLRAVQAASLSAGIFRSIEL